MMKLTGFNRNCNLNFQTDIQHANIQTNRTYQSEIMTRGYVFLTWKLLYFIGSNIFIKWKYVFGHTFWEQSRILRIGFCFWIGTRTSFLNLWGAPEFSLLRIFQKSTVGIEHWIYPVWNTIIEPMTSVIRIHTHYTFNKNFHSFWFGRRELKIDRQ